MALSGEIRQQTAIDPSGIADDHSLRTIRVARQGTVFQGNVQAPSDAPAIVDTLALACLNLRRLGTKRNRGFGEVTCSLRDEDDEPISIVKKLEGLCND
jgi:CRISPR-associated protein Csx10